MIIASQISLPGIGQSSIGLEDTVRITPSNRRIDIAPVKIVGLGVGVTFIALPVTPASYEMACP